MTSFQSSLPAFSLPRQSLTNEKPTGPKTTVGYAIGSAQLKHPNTGQVSLPPLPILSYAVEMCPSHYVARDAQHLTNQQTLKVGRSTRAPLHRRTGSRANTGHFCHLITLTSTNLPLEDHSHSSDCSFTPSIISRCCTFVKCQAARQRPCICDCLDGDNKMPALRKRASSGWWCPIPSCWCASSGRGRGSARGRGSCWAGSP